MANTAAIIQTIGVYLNEAFKDALNANFEALKSKDVANYDELLGIINNAIAAIHIVASSDDVTNNSNVPGSKVTDALNKLNTSTDLASFEISDLNEKVNQAKAQATEVSASLANHASDHLVHIQASLDPIRDTTGATQSDLEIEVNKIKNVLRYQNLIKTEL